MVVVCRVTCVSVNWLSVYGVCVAAPTTTTNGEVSAVGLTPVHTSQLSCVKASAHRTVVQ